MKEFNFDDFLEFIKTENSRLAKKYNHSTQKDMVLEAMTKLVEENGELANEVLIKLGLCRQEKQRENSAELAEEFADCMIVLLLLGDRLGIDVKTALKNKEDKVNKRYAE